MNRNELRRVDLNLLVVFETLMHEKNLTRAAEKLFLGQPAVSAALARLRSVFDDPLLVRSGLRYEPTARAINILDELQPALDTISSAVSRARDFNPGTHCGSFRIGLSDDAEFGLFPKLFKVLQTEAPNMIVITRRVNFLLLPAMLASGEISVGVSYTTDLPANSKRCRLRDMNVKVLRSDDRSNPLALDDFCQRPHVLVSFSGDLSGNIDEDLRLVGRSRRVVLAVPQFSGLRSLLPGTDLLASVPDYAATALIDGTGLRAEDPPFPIVTSELSMAWSEGADRDPAEKWLRSKIVECMGD